MSTIDTLMEAMQERVEKGEIIGPHDWIDYAGRLNLFRGIDDNVLYKLGQRIAQLRAEYVKDGMSVAAARTLIEASDDYREYKQLQAKLDRVIEEIRLAKIRSRSAAEEMRGYH
jgi:hypothetical protein